MSETSPTEQVDSGAGSSNEDLPENQHQPSADEQQTDSVSSDDSQDAGQDDNSQPQGGSTDEDSSSSDDDDGLAKFAKSQGFDPDNLTDGERKALKIAHDNQKAFRTNKQEQTDKLKETVADTHSVTQEELDELDDEAADIRQTKSEVAALRAEQKVTNFYLRNPDARDFDKEMGELVLEEAKRNGKEAARYLASDLDRLLVLAKARRGVSTEEARAEGAREERENLRRRQEGSADSGHASNSNQTGRKLTRSDIASMSDEDYTKLRESGELDEMIARGDLY